MHNDFNLESYRLHQKVGDVQNSEREMEGVTESWIGNWGGCYKVYYLRIGDLCNACSCFLNWLILGLGGCSLGASTLCLVLWDSLNMKLRNPEPLESE